jgi:hypothetical protein
MYFVVRYTMGDRGAFVQSTTAAETVPQDELCVRDQTSNIPALLRTLGDECFVLMIDSIPIQPLELPVFESGQLLKAGAEATLQTCQSTANIGISPVCTC